MAQLYLVRLTDLMEKIGVDKNKKLECKHFFGGAACYLNGKIFVSLSPVGFALKLPERYRAELIKEKGVKTLQYFPKAPTKKEYVVLPERMVTNIEVLRHWVKISVDYVLNKSSD